MGKSTISMAIFNSYVKLPEGKHKIHGGFSGFTKGFTKGIERKTKTDFNNNDHGDFSNSS